MSQHLNENVTIASHLPAISVDREWICLISWSSTFQKVGGIR